MALIKYGGGVIGISGSIAGDVHSRNRFGSYIRPRTKPVNPHSERQEDIRAILSYLAEYWHGDLTIAQRSAWEVYAAAVPMTNRLGETIYLTGYNHFMRVNTPFNMYSGFVVDAAPVILSLPEKDATLVCSEEDVAAQTFTFTFSNADWAADGETKLRILLYQGHPTLASRNFFAGPWRYMYDVDTIEGAAGTATCPAVFPFGVGQKVWFQARLLTVSYRLSNLWTTAPRTIVADP